MCLRVSRQERQERPKGSWRFALTEHDHNRPSSILLLCGLCLSAVIFRSHARTARAARHTRERHAQRGTRAPGEARRNLCLASLASPPPEHRRADRTRADRTPHTAHAPTAHRTRADLPRGEHAERHIHQRSAPAAHAPTAHAPTAHAPTAELHPDRGLQRSDRSAGALDVLRRRADRVGDRGHRLRLLHGRGLVAGGTHVRTQRVDRLL